MPFLQRRTHLSHVFHSSTVLVLLLTLFMFLFTPSAHSQKHDMDSMPGMDMSAPPPPEDPVAAAAKRLADRQESEFNHHLAGLIIIFAGIFMLAEGYLVKRWPSVRYAWPICFLVVGLFVLIFSDTEIWPLGPQSLWYAITHEAEDLQHNYSPFFSSRSVTLESREREEDGTAPGPLGSSP